MMKKPITAILFALVLGIPGVASANWNVVENYQKNSNTAIYLSGALNAFSAANAYNKSIGIPPLYCKPSKLILDSQNAVSIFEQELKDWQTVDPTNDNNWKTVNLEYVLLSGLQRTFPCD